MKRREFLMASAGIMGITSQAGRVRAVSQEVSLEPIESRHLDLTPKSSDQWELVFRPNRAIRILQVTDTHFSSTAEKDQRTIQTLNSLIRQSAPDLIVHTGDFVNNDSDDPVSWQGIDYFNGIKIPWALCFGNHDYPVANAPGSLPLDDFRKSLKNSATGYVDLDQRRQYCYRHDVKGKREEPTVSLFYFQVGYAEGDRKISDNQLAWFESQMKTDEEKGWNGPILVFVHIPLIEYETMAVQGRATGGFKNEKVCYDSDTGASFKAFRASKRVRGVFCGHDHVNSYFGAWQGIALHYGRVSGWGGYGKWERGGRLILLDPDNGRFTHQEILVQT